MNKKVLTYLMMAAVIGIWGTIVWKFLQKDEPNIVVTQLPVNYESSDDSIVEDDYELQLQYRDPFLGKHYSEKKRSNDQSFGMTSNNKKPPKKVEEEREKPWPAVVYRGIMKDNKTGSAIAMMEIESQLNLMNKGDEFQDLTVKAIYSDSVLVAMDDDLKIFYK